MEIFKLFGSIFIDNDEANKSLHKTDEQAGKVGITLGSTIKTAAKWGAGVAAAAGAAGGALGGLVAKAVQSAGEITKFSQVTGMSVKGFQEWDFVMKTFGYSAEQASGDLAALAEKAMDAAQGVGEGAELFRELGIAVTDTEGKLKSQEQLFNEVIFSLQGMEDITRRNAIASALLSTTGEELVPILNMTNEELQNMKANASVINEEDLNKAERFRLKWEEAKAMFSSLVTQLGIMVLPAFEQLVNWSIQHLPKVVPVFQFIGEVVGIVFKYMRLIIGDAVSWMRDHIIDPFVNWLSRVWEERGPPIVAAVEALWDGIKAVFSQVFTNLRGLWDVFILAFHGDWEGAWERLKEVAVGAWNALPDLLTGIWDPLVVIADQIMRAVIGVIRNVFGDDVANIFQAAWDAVLIIFETARENILTALSLFTKLFKGDWSGTWEDVKLIFWNVWDGLVRIVRGPLNTISTIVLKWVGRIIKPIRMLKDRVIGLITDLVSGIQEWFSESTLGKTFEWLGDLVDKATGKFFEMYDKVVGHSYVPDMVDEIGEAVDRLRERLSRPVAKYTAEAIKHFGNMSDSAVAAAFSIADGFDQALRQAGSTIADWISQTTFDLFNGVKGWENIFDGFGQVTQSIFESIFREITREMVKNIIAQNTWLASTLATISTAIAGYISMAYSALVGFFWFLGPAAPIAAAAVIATVVAAVAKYAGQGFRSLFGGGGSSAPSKPPSSGGSQSSGGQQVSELTGPTRDLFVDLLAPLANLNAIVGPIQRIRDILDSRLPDFAGYNLAGSSSAGGVVNVNVDQLIVQAQDNSTDNIADASIERIERALAERLAFALRGRGNG